MDSTVLILIAVEVILCASASIWLAVANQHTKFYRIFATVWPIIALVIFIQLIY